METSALKKILLYSVFAVTLGLALTLTPLMTSTEIKSSNLDRIMPDYSGYSDQSEAYGLGAPTHFEIFAISFIIALAVYVLFKYKMPL